MALIKCPECSKEVSDKAKTCPHCGYPLTNNEKTNTVLVNGTKYDISILDLNNNDIAKMLFYKVFVYFLLKSYRIVFLYLIYHILKNQQDCYLVLLQLLQNLDY